MKTSFQNNNPIKFCDICGCKFHASQLRMQWDGILACLPNRCWSPKHPADNPLPVVIDNLMIPNARPELPDEFISEREFSRWGGAWIITFPNDIGRMNYTLNKPKWGSTGAKWGELG